MTIHLITKNLPPGYKIKWWTSEDRWGKKRHYAPYWKGTAMFGYKTFGTLAEAKKKIREHIDTLAMKERARQMQERISKPPELKRTIHLQGIGEHKAKQAQNFKVGDIAVFNYGETEKILSVRTKGKSVYWDVKSKSGKIYKDVRKIKTTLVGYK